MPTLLFRPNEVFKETLICKNSQNNSSVYKAKAVSLNEELCVKEFAFNSLAEL